MTHIVRLDIEHFRSIKALQWMPYPGINCLVGHGDSGKSSILDAIEWCLSARGQLRISDADFYCHDTDKPIRITVLLGVLEDELMNLNRYGDFLRGFSMADKTLEDEPGQELDTVLEMQLIIDADLVPEWRLRSDRVDPDAPARTLQWADRQRIEPIRIGAYSATHLGWHRGSILERLTDESAKAPAALADATRFARASFGGSANAQLAATLAVANKAAKTTGLDQHGDIGAELDAHAIALSGGSLSLHDGPGVPLNNLGLASFDAAVHHDSLTIGHSGVAG